MRGKEELQPVQLGVTTVGPGQRYYHNKYKIPPIKWTWLPGPFHSMSLIRTINMNPKQCYFHLTVAKTNILVLFGSLVYLIPKPKSFQPDICLSSPFSVSSPVNCGCDHSALLPSLTSGGNNAWRVLGSQLTLFNIFCFPYVLSTAKFLTDLTRTS